MCDNYVILSDNAAHTHCLPDVETLNVGTNVQCIAPRLRDGEMKPCNAKFYVTTKGIWKRKHKVYADYYYAYYL